MKSMLSIVLFRNKQKYILIFLSILVGIIYQNNAEAFPIISEMEIISGERGIAVSFNADASFEAIFSGKEKQVTAILKKCVYGLPEFVYEQFSPSSPIKKIIAHEKINAEVEIILYLKHEVSVPIKTIQKNHQWIALISQNPVQFYSWKTTQDDTRNATVKQSVTTPMEKIQESSSLLNIRLLERGQISELAFEFDKKVNGTIERKNNVVSLYVDNSLNKIGKKEFFLPENAAFKNVSIVEERIKHKLSLKAVFSIDTLVIDSEFNMVFTQGEVLSFFLVKRNNRKATLWTSGQGLAVDYHFYDVPSYNVDLNKISKRAQRDAAVQLSRKKIFAINSKEKIDVKDSIIESKKEIIQKDTLIAKTDETEILKNAIQSRNNKSLTSITLSEVNMRNNPSLKGKIVRKIANGDTVSIVEKRDKWTKVLKENDTGFIYSQYLQELDTSGVKIGDKLAMKDSLNDSNILVNQQITKVSTTESLPMSSNTALQADVPNNMLPATQDIPLLRKKVIQYHGGGRDPFQPLVLDSISSSEYPFVENLNLVGVLMDDVDKIALCEDTRNQNRSFTLREHDPVFKGKVLKIYKDKIVFLITEYGISRSLTLSLEKVLPDQEVSKK
jgi:hypothetical protein